jgi:energy-coupling factor transporter ATP-binding protein EcfA2
MTQVLEIRDVSIRFGGLQALDGVDLDVGEWEIVGLIGPNGAGKTTFFNCLMNIYKPDKGKVVYRGKDITTVSTYKKAAMGLGRTWQNLGVIRTLSVLDTLVRRGGRAPGERGGDPGVPGAAPGRQGEGRRPPLRHPEAVRSGDGPGHRSRRAAPGRALVGDGA